MSKALQAVRGMNDITPAQTPAWQYLEAALRSTAEQYGYQEIRFPIVESTDLFKRSVGEDTDIVEKEMYTFEDRNGDMLTLRPEGTAPCVRAGIQQGLLYNQIQRLWYMGEMFRHERPQKGRYRQFCQFGVEAFGIADAILDAELILFSNQLWKKLNLSSEVTLELNSLGSAESRKNYREALVNYFKPLESKLDEDCKRRLNSNPMRILDSKNPDMQPLVKDAPKLSDFLDESSQAHFKKLCDLLDAAGVKYQLNPNLVRGLDYYSDTVFEWTTDKLGAQATICAGGRYDSLVEQLGGKATPAAGFAMGLERILLLLETLSLLPNHLAYQPDVYLIAVGEAAECQGLVMAEQWRTALPGLNLLMNAGGGSFKSQFKRADKSGAELAVIIGEEELQRGALTVKYLRADKPQETVGLNEMERFLGLQIED